MIITWTQALEAMYGTQVSKEQIPVWEHYLKSEKTNSAELVPAIGLAAEEGIKPEEWRVTVRDLRKWLKIYRARECAKNRTDNAEARKAAIISEWREKLSRGAKRDDMLEVIDSQPWDVVSKNDVIKEILK